VLKLKQAQLDIELKTVQADAYKQKLCEQVLAYYYAALVAQQAIGLNKASLATSDSVLFLSEQKFQQGMIDQASLHQARINVNTVQQLLLGNQLALEQYRAELRILWGLPASASFELTQTLSPQSLGTIADVAPDKNLLAYTAQARLSAIDVRLKKTAFLPKLTANAYFGYQQLSNSFGFGDKWNAYNYIGLNLNIPISTGFMNRGNLRAAMMNHQINESMARLETLAAESKDQLLLVAYQNSLQQVRWAESNYQLFKQNEALSLQKFMSGLTGLEPYFKAYQDRLQAENNYLTTLSSLYSNYSTIMSRK
jgi:outer membrane protein TolC